MTAQLALTAGQLIARVCLFAVAAIALSGGALQFFLGQPETSPRLDNVHRFMAGVYFSTGLICLWAGVTTRPPGLLVPHPPPFVADHALRRRHGLSDPLVGFEESRGSLPLLPLPHTLIIPRGAPASPAPAAACLGRDGLPGHTAHG